MLLNCLFKNHYCKFYVMYIFYHSKKQLQSLNLEDRTTKEVMDRSRDTDVEWMDLWTQWRKERVGQIGRVVLKYMYYHM